MAKLGREERGFCRSHGIPEERLFDASGLKRAAYREIMKTDEKWAAYGVTPCGPEGHVLRNRHGTCLMCNTAQVAYLLRSKMAGYLYVATGAQGKLMKLGFSNDPANRLAIANYESWGGYDDWQLRAYGWSSMGGRLESGFHKVFKETSTPLTWIRNGKIITSREAYHANLIGAVEQLVWLCDGPPEIIPPEAV